MIKNIVWFLVFVLVFDFIGFIAWSMSGQVPLDNFYLGIITKSIINIII